MNTVTEIEQHRWTSHVREVFTVALECSRDTGADRRIGALDRLIAVFAKGTWGGPGPVVPVGDAVPVRVGELTAKIRAVRHAKEVAIDAQDFTRAAAEREVEKGLLVERAALVDEVRPTLDVAALLDELELLRDEVVRLRVRLESGTP